MRCWACRRAGCTPTATRWRARSWAWAWAATPREERARLERHYPELGGTLGDALLAVHRCYYNEIKPVLGRLKGIAHITGGGLPGNLPRILPEGLAGPPAQRRVAGAAHLPPHPGAR